MVWFGRIFMKFTTEPNLAQLITKNKNATCFNSVTMCTAAGFVVLKPIQNWKFGFFTFAKPHNPFLLRKPIKNSRFDRLL